MKNEYKEKPVYKDERGMVIKPGDICLARHHFPRTNTIFYAKVCKLRHREDGEIEAMFFGMKGWYPFPLKLANK